MNKQLVAGNHVLFNVNETSDIPEKVYSRGRIGLFQQKHPSLPEMDINTLIARLCEVEEGINDQLVGMEKAAHVAILGLITGDNTFMLSLPGAAKTTLSRILARSIDGKFYRKNFTPDMSVSDLFGPISVSGINAGRYEREWDGLATASYAMMDEFFKGGKTIQNNVLDVCEEHTVSTPHETRNIPLLAASSASNELADPTPKNAVWDRFAYRIELGYPTREDEIKRIFKADGGTRTNMTVIDPDEIILLQGFIDWKSRNLPDEIIEKMTEVILKLIQTRISPSPRRMMMWARGIVAESLLKLHEAPGTPMKTVLEDAMLVGEDILWIEPEQRRAVAQIVALNAGEERSYMMQIRGDIEQFQLECNSFDFKKATQALGRIKSMERLLEDQIHSPKYQEEKEELLRTVKNVKLAIFERQSEISAAEELNN